MKQLKNRQCQYNQARDINNNLAASAAPTQNLGIKSM